jgi:tetratricopeptide (TPR) repeat protein
VVFLNEIRHGATGEDGAIDLHGIKPGRYRARVRTVGFADWTGVATVAAGGIRTVKVVQTVRADEAVHHYQKGDDLREKGKHSDAVGEYLQAIGMRPALSEARIGAARSLISLQKFDEAEMHLNAALKNRGGRIAEAQTVLANMRRQQGLVDEAIVEYRKALRLSRGVSPEAHIGLALALEESGEMDEAIEEFRTGIAQDMDTEPILYYLLASALEKEGRNKEAIDAYRNYLRLAPQGQYASAVESMIDRLKESINDK